MLIDDHIKMLRVHIMMRILCNLLKKNLHETPACFDTFNNFLCFLGDWLCVYDK